MASPDKKAFVLRIDPELWLAIERLAASELRSVNAQMEFMLRESLIKRGIAVGKKYDAKVINRSIPKGKDG